MKMKHAGPWSKEYSFLRVIVLSLSLSLSLSFLYLSFLSLLTCFSFPLSSPHWSYHWHPGWEEWSPSSEPRAMAEWWGWQAEEQADAKKLKSLPCIENILLMLQNCRRINSVGGGGPLGAKIYCWRSACKRWVCEVPQSL